DHGHGAHGGHEAHEVDVWAEFFQLWKGEQGLAKTLVNKQGDGLHILMPPTSSPAMQALIARIQTSSFPKARFHTWSALHADNELTGAQMAFGRPVATHYDLSNA